MARYYCQPVNNERATEVEWKPYSEYWNGVRFRVVNILREKAGLPRDSWNRLRKIRGCCNLSNPHAVSSMRNPSGGAPGAVRLIIGACNAIRVSIDEKPVRRCAPCVLLRRICKCGIIDEKPVRQCAPAAPVSRTPLPCPSMRNPWAVRRVTADTVRAGTTVFHRLETRQAVRDRQRDVKPVRTTGVHR